VQYRNAIDAPAPAAIQDVRCAMAWVKRNAATYNFDPNRIIPWGGSAGATWRSWPATRPPPSIRPAAPISPKSSAVFDMYGDTNLAEVLTRHGSSDSVHQWLGMDLPLPRELPPQRPRQPPRRLRPPPQLRPATTTPLPPARARSGPALAESTAAMLARAREMSPITYVSPTFHPPSSSTATVTTRSTPPQSWSSRTPWTQSAFPNIHYVVVGGGHGNFPPAENTKGMLLALHFLKDHGVIQ